MMMSNNGLGLEKWFGYIFILYAAVSPVSLSGANIALGLIILFGTALLWKRREGPKFQNKILVPMLLLFFWAGTTRLIAGNFNLRDSVGNIWEYSPIVLIPVFLSVSKVRKTGIIMTLMTFSSIVCFLGIIQFLHPSVVYPFPRQLVNQDFRGFFDHHLHTGGFYSMTTVLAFSLALFWRSDSKNKGMVWLFFFLNLIALFLSMARSYYISVSLLLLVLMAVKNLRWLAYGGMVFVGIFALLLSFPNPVKSRIQTISDPNFASNKERVYMWKAAIEMFKEHPLAGVGKGNWSKEAKENYFPCFKKEWPVFGAFAHAHNVYLTLLAETGGIGLLLFLLFWSSIAWALFAGISRVQSGSLDMALIIGSLGSLGNLLVAGMFENNFGTSVVLLLISFLVGLSLSAACSVEGLSEDS